ncbi:MAG: hypothetical protein IIZ25_03945 [Thermoguttaceae bacterium]|nr:hypothetical protein [Thermoguttaceae bacterium]
MTLLPDDPALPLLPTPIRSFVHFSIIDSTNDWGGRYLRLFHPPGERGRSNGRFPLLVLADAQSAARGRFEHRWWSPAGGLAFSLLARWRDFGLARDESPELSSRVAHAVLSVIQSVLDFSGVETTAVIQQPNDIMVGGRKISGILIESPSPQYVVIGIGVNVNNRSSDYKAPDNNPRGYVPVSLFDLTGKSWSCCELMGKIVRELFRVG